VFLGVDHGTRAIRFVVCDGGERSFELPRVKAAVLSELEVVKYIEHGLGVHLEDIKLAVVTYSMGDGLERITPLSLAGNRGVVSVEGAGPDIGGGTRVFDALKNSGIPGLLMPGLHGNCADPRMNVFSHTASPEKIGLAYLIASQGFESFVVSDVSSNTVTLAVTGGRILGGLDACIFAPGLVQGPLDLDAIRRVDQGEITANEAFSRGGVLKRTPYQDIKSFLSALERGEDEAVLALDTLALLVAMEIKSLQVLLPKNGGCVFLGGGMASLVKEKVEEALGSGVEGCLDRFAAARGCALAARDIHRGKRDIMGIPVDESVEF